ncbi:ankyrin repeat domain-containing protein [Rufibacter soli]
MKTSWGILLLIAALFYTTSLYAQTGPWAKYDQEMKDAALYREASAGNLEEVKSIVAGGGNIHYVTTQTKYTILMAAAGSGKIEVVRYLLDLGADPTPKDWWNYTALDKARFAGAKDIEALLQAKMAGNQTKTPEVQPQPKDDKKDDKKEGKEEDKKDNKEENQPANGTPPPPKSGPITGSKWAAFGSYSVGDSVLYWVPTGWRRAVIKEVGVQVPTGKISIDYSYKKYLVDPDAYALGNDWYEWSGVVKTNRQPFWTNWFIGEWQVGEVQAHSNEVKAGKETDTYYFQKASEKLQVFANNTYRWQLMDGKTVITGKWKPIPNEPGIVLLKAYRGFDWSLRNSTGVHDFSIRKLDMINLKPSAQVMSINGQRKTTE